MLKLGMKLFLALLLLSFSTISYSKTFSNCFEHALKILNISDSNQVQTQKIKDELDLNSGKYASKKENQNYKAINKILKKLDSNQLDEIEKQISFLKDIPTGFKISDLNANLDAIGHGLAYGNTFATPMRSRISEFERNSLGNSVDSNSLFQNLQNMINKRSQNLKKEIDKLIDFKLLERSYDLIDSQGLFLYSNPKVHTMVDILEKMDRVGSFNTYIKKHEYSDLINDFVSAIRKTRDDHYSGRNKMLREKTLLEANGTFVGVGSEAKDITLDMVISSRRFLAGNAGAGLWAPSDAVGNFSKETSFFPLEQLYGEGATRKIFWVLNDHKRYQSKEGVAVRTGWGNVDLTKMRVVVNYAKDEKGNDIPKSLETLVPSEDPEVGAIPFFFLNINGEWVPQRDFTMPNGRKLPVEKACILCHQHQTKPHVLTPVPGKRFGYDKDRLREKGGYNQEVVDEVLKFLDETF